MSKVSCAIEVHVIELTGYGNVPWTAVGVVLPTAIKTRSTDVLDVLHVPNLD